MDRRDFFGCIGKILMVGAVTIVAPEVLEPAQQCVTDEEFTAIHSGEINWAATKGPDFALAS